MALQNDVMIVFGSFGSANTCRLTEISGSVNPRTHQAVTAGRLLREWFVGARTVGITAGASTPDQLIGQVAERISSFAPGSEIADLRHGVRKASGEGRPWAST